MEEKGSLLQSTAEDSSEFISKQKQVVGKTQDGFSNRLGA